MSVVESPSLAVAIDCLRQRFDRTALPSKRKLDDYAPDDDNLLLLDDDNPLFARMKRSGDSETPLSSDASDDGIRPHDYGLKSAVTCSRHASSSSSNCCESGSGSSSGGCEVGGLQFFVRVLSRTMVIHASPEDTVRSVHEQIWATTGIPTCEQRLIYHGRQLQLEHSLAECGVQNDASLQLTGRMRSTGYPESWTVADDIISMACRVRAEMGVTGPSNDAALSIGVRRVEWFVRTFLKMTSRFTASGRTSGHLQVFLLSGAAAALVMLYSSIPMGLKDCRLCAERSIRYLLGMNPEILPKCFQVQCGPIVLELCKLLSGMVGRNDPIYKSCRNTFGLLLSTEAEDDSTCFSDPSSTYVIKEVFPFVSELAGILSPSLLESLAGSLPSEPLRLLSNVLSEFSNFMRPLRRAIEDQRGGLGPIPITLSEGHTQYEDWFGSLHAIFMDLLEKVDHCLKKVDEAMVDEGPDLGEDRWTEWTIFLVLLTELNGLSNIYEGAEEILHSVILERRVPLNALIRHAKRSDSLWWLLKHKDVTNFESRRHLVMMMFPEGKDDYDAIHEMLIDRSQILTESFEYIAHADPGALQSGLFMEFKNEEATGPGVLREWFCLLCREIFNTQNVLFTACPNDCRRFFPNPTSVVEPLHPDYFGFCGRVIALALMHKVQIGMVFDRVFFLQLAGKPVTLEDVKDADPYLYNSCKDILEMDANSLDSDILGLTFVREYEELGSRKIVDLCDGGRDVIVNSRNRQKYVDLLIQHCFVTRISDQVARFSQGFSDILSDSKFQTLFFQSLELEDLDRMLGGTDGAICTKDWKAHTEYNGYQESDRQICWFWKVLESMPANQQRVLLFFWTSVKYLPVDGFGGLSSKLYIYRTPGCHDRLPTSHTCFYRLCLPSYPSLSIMRRRLHFITQEHVGCSFGIF